MAYPGAQVIFPCFDGLFDIIYCDCAYLTTALYNLMKGGYGGGYPGQQQGGGGYPGQGGGYPGQQQGGGYPGQQPAGGYQGQSRPGSGYPGAGGGHPGGYPGGYPGVSPEIQGWFNAVDVDKSGKISAKELQAALVNGQGKSFSDTACSLMIGMMFYYYYLRNFKLYIIFVYYFAITYLIMYFIKNTLLPVFVSNE